MTFFESLIAILLLAIALLQVSRRTSIPYPTMLAAAGVAVALIPGAPAITLDGHTALALFLAPVLLDAAFDFPLAAIRTLWRPLIGLAVGAVVATAAVVAWIGWAFAGLPLAAAIALGAIVAPPDAAAATTVLRTARLPRRTVEVLTGESLLNDASALLLYAGAVAVQSHGGIDAGVGIRLGLAAPGGLLLGIGFAYLNRWIMRWMRGSLGGNLLQFVNCYLLWLIADRLGLSPVLAIVAMAMTIAGAPDVRGNPRDRVQSFAVWMAVVFLLNVIAFLLMGMQVRAIVSEMRPERLRETAWVAGLVVAGVIVTRMAWVLAYGFVSRRVPALHGDTPPPTVGAGVVVGWCGMRGLVTLAAAYALPGDFPQRDLIVLCAFAVVLATLVVQGLTLAPLIGWLGLRQGHQDRNETKMARRRLGAAAMEAIADQPGKIAGDMRSVFALHQAKLDGGGARTAVIEQQRLKRLVIAAERQVLHDMRDDGTVGEETFTALQEELDWRELVVGSEDGTTIEAG